MPASIGNGTSQAYQPALSSARTEKAAAQAEAIKVRQSEAVAETVKRQADFSSSRAEVLSRQAEQMENRVQSQDPGKGIGGQVDITV
ncbi:hypothetical protein [Roseibium marinum]|nr:hypothetical protein [Roseibium marinum]